MSVPAPEPAVPGITWLASYPKSGNTWTRILLSNLIAPDEVDEDVYAALRGSISSNRHSFDSATGLASSDMTDDEIDLLRPAYYRLIAAEAAERLFTKVHDACHRNGAGELLFPADASFGAIYLVRHPYDVAVSYANHQGHGDYDRIIAHMNNPQHVLAGGAKGQLRQRTQGWSGHYRSWHEQDSIPVLTVRYEDMLADTAACLRKMLAFLQLDETYDDQAIARAVDASRFDRLREKEDRVGFRERPEKTGRFFRSGKAGDGFKILGDSQRKAIYEANREVMQELGYEA